MTAAQASLTKRTDSFWQNNDRNGGVKSLSCFHIPVANEALSGGTHLPIFDSPSWGMFTPSQFGSHIYSPIHIVGFYVLDIGWVENDVELIFG
jgi:hypothetical protein